MPAAGQKDDLTLKAGPPAFKRGEKPVTTFSFFAGLGGNEFDFEVMPTWTEGGTNTLE